MEIYRFNQFTTTDLASKKPAVVVLSQDVSEKDAVRIKKQFPNALCIAEIRLGAPAKEGYFSVLCVHTEELVGYNYVLQGCKAINIKGATATFYSELVKYRESIAIKAGIDLERVRFCCNFISERGIGNFSCYTAETLRDYASEMGISGIFPSAKQEVKDENTFCLCVKTWK